MFNLFLEKLPLGSGDCLIFHKIKVITSEILDPAIFCLIYLAKLVVK